MTASCCVQQGYSSPQEAMKAPIEKLLYTVALVNSKDRPDYVVTIDADPESKTYSKVIHRTYLNYNGDEVHHFGWNSCSSCQHIDKIRSHLIVPGFISNRIYTLDVETDPRAPKIDRVIEPEETESLGLGKFHTTHC